MLKNFPSSFSKVTVTLFVALTLYASCTKGYDPGNYPSDRYHLLTGQPDSVIWILHSIQVDNSIDTSAKGTMKVYHPDGTFTDYMGFTGYWILYSRDSLIESTRSSVNPTSPYFTSHFHIDYLEKGNLQLTYKDSDKKIRLLYDSKK